MLFVNYFAFYSCISVFLCISFVFSQLQMVLAAKKKAYRLMSPIRCIFIVADSGHRSADRSGISVLDLC